MFERFKRLRIILIVSSVLSIFVHFIVGQLDFFEGDDLFSQLVASKGRVWMGVKSVGRWWIGLAGYQP